MVTLLDGVAINVLEDGVTQERICFLSRSGPSFRVYKAIVPNQDCYTSSASVIV